MKANYMSGDPAWGAPDLRASQTSGAQINNRTLGANTQLTGADQLKAYQQSSAFTNPTAQMPGPKLNLKQTYPGAPPMMTTGDPSMSWGQRPGGTGMLGANAFGQQRPATPSIPQPAAVPMPGAPAQTYSTYGPSLQSILGGARG